MGCQTPCLAEGYALGVRVDRDAWVPFPSPTCLPRFPSDLLLTSSSGELWRMVRIGGQPLGFGENHTHPKLGVRTSLWVSTAFTLSHPCLQPSDECGIVAQIAGPLAAADISAYYISTFNFDHALVSAWTGLEVPARPQRWGREEIPADLGSWHPWADSALACHAVPLPQVPEDGISSVIGVLQRRPEGLTSKDP